MRLTTVSQTTTTEHHRHRARAALRDWRDAITPRTTLLVVGVFVLMLAFAVSYVGALHHPKLSHADLAVAAPATSRTALIGQLNAISGQPVSARAVADGATTRHQVTRRDADGALVVFATAAFTMAAQVVAGVIGIGIAIAVFVILGNPSSGGVYAAPLLPGFWRAIGPWITTGAATQLVRNVTYFDSVKITDKIWVLAAYAAVGVVVGLAVSGLRGRRPRRPGGPAHLAVEGR